MQKTALFILGIMLVGMGSVAKADSPNKRERERFRFNCRFLAGLEKNKGAANCTAFGRVSLRERDDVTVANENHDHEGRRNRLTVQCNGTPIYSDGAELSRFDGNFFLSAFGGSPVIKFSRHEGHDHDRNREDDAFVTSAWLNVGGLVSEGFCAFEEDEDHHGGPTS